MKQDITQD